jgi:hypothetical protein
MGPFTTALFCWTRFLKSVGLTIESFEPELDFMFSPLSILKFIVVVVALGNCGAFAAEPLVTRWAKDVSQESPWPEYPRPQLVRSDWQNLNGSWDLTITSADAERPTEFREKILVPFPIESRLSGVQRTFLPEERAWYRRTFKSDENWKDQRILLHFGAVDWHAEVWINGKRAGEHRGGYDPFTFDITDHVDVAGENVLVVAVKDPTDKGTQPRGKQQLSPEGIWYTPASGIWQTVWLEPVAKSYIRDLRIIPDFENSQVEIGADIVDAKAGQSLKVDVLAGKKIVASQELAAAEKARLEIESARPWSPSDPFLYNVRVSLVADGKVVDSVTSYFGMRSIKLGKDRNGLTRMMFNGEPLFQYGPLDQGFWPDGIYLAPTDEALRYDLELAKKLGFNMVRKHVKVEPARWYYWCDRLGLLVWQDMPSGDRNVQWPADGVEMERIPKSAAQYRVELQRMVDHLRNSPSVIVWVPFNEAWGQFDTNGVTAWLEKYDPTRLVNSASGGNDFGYGHIKDDHFYPGPGAPPAEVTRAAVLGEFGGLGLPIAGHTWQDKENWGYRSFETSEQLTAAYLELIAKLRPLVESHLSAAVYTQTTDVEIEVNGLVTYDREVVKVDEKAVRLANEQLFKPLPERSASENVSTAVLAWWRFEDGTAGKPVGDLKAQMGAISAKDFSGHNNHLFAYSADTAPSISDQVPTKSLGLAGVENKLCLDDTARPANGVSTRDLYVNPEVARTHMDQLNRYPLADWTVEASLCPAESNGEQVAVAKEEDRGGTMTPLFQLGLFGSPPVIGVEFVDAAGETVAIHSDIQPGIEKWWHVAVTCDNGLARLYIADDQPAAGYTLVGEAPVKGTLLRRGGTWLVGRGSEGGRMGRDFFGKIDEVRISTKALDPTEFLFGGAAVTANGKSN